MSPRHPSQALAAAIVITMLGLSAAHASPCHSIEAYGGSPANADNSAALMAALAASPGQSPCATIPPGQFSFAAPVVIRLGHGPVSASLTGAGADVSTLTWPQGGGLQFLFAGADNAVHLRNLSLTTAAAGQGTALALTLNANQGGNPADNALSDLTNLTIRGADGYALADYWTTGIALAGVSNVNLTALTVTGPGGAAYGTRGEGLTLLGRPGTPAVIFNIAGSSFDNLQKGVVYGRDVQGLTVTQSNFTGDDFGILVPPNRTGLDQLTVASSQFNCALAGVHIGSFLSNTLFSGNLFIVPNTGIGIDLPTAYLYSAVGNAFNDGSAVNTATRPIGIEIGASSGGGVITGNVFNSMATAILLDASATGANVQSNDYSGNTRAVRDNGTGNTIGGGSP